MARLMLPGSAERIPRRTKPEVNARIVERTLSDVRRYREAPRDEREAHVRDLNREWDIERWITALDGGMLVAGGILGLLIPRRTWFLLPLVIGGFLVWHALFGWCTLVPLLRRRGVRTPYEIADEKAALLR